MDLREFVAETLIQIVQGVSDAQVEQERLGANINPRILGSPEHFAKLGFLETGDSPAQVVQFDVALTVKDATGTKGGIGVVSGIFNLGSSGQSQTENLAVSRVKFSVPLTLRREMIVRNATGG